MKRLIVNADDFGYARGVDRGIIEGLSDGVSELMCHPGYVTNDLKSSYNQQREIELATLIDPRIKSTIEKQGIQLINYKNFQDLYRS